MLVPWSNRSLIELNVIIKSNNSILTKEERDILILAASHPNDRHFNNTEIANCLGISVSRVKSLIHQTCIKFGARNRAEAILAAVKQEEIRLDEIYTLDELAEFLQALHPDVVRSITRIVTKEPEYRYLPWSKDQIVHMDGRQDTVLTRREQNILALIGRGLTNKEIADIQYISINTVRTSLYWACQKLGVRNRLDAVMLALKRGEIEIFEMVSFNELIENMAPLGAETLEQIAQLMSRKNGRKPVQNSSFYNQMFSTLFRIKSYLRLYVF